MDTVRQFYFRVWRSAVLVVSMVLIAYLLYFHKLGSLLPGYSSAELRTYTGVASWHRIATDPIYAPYKLIVWLLSAVLHHSILMTRVVAAAFGIAAVLTFFAVIRPWYGFRSAFLATFLFATSAGFLHTARLGTAVILQMSILVFLGAVLWYRRPHRHQALIGYGVVALFALLWYIPGMVWFELLGLILLRGGVRRQLRGISTPQLTGWGLTFLIIIMPLVLAGFRAPKLLLNAAGLPHSLHAVSQFPSNLAHAILSIAVRSNGSPLLWVGHAPLLDVIGLALGAIGAYYYLYRERSGRGVFLAGSGVLCLVLIGFGGVGFACLIPIIYLFIASGLDHLLGQWLAVFPRNPIARFTGVSLICLMLFFSVLYQVRSYFVAWPNSPATRQTFSHKQ